MPVLSFYKTILDAGHTRVVDDIDAYLSSIAPVYATPNIDVVAGAENLSIQIPVGISSPPNYCKIYIDGVGVVAYYHVKSHVVTTGMMQCDLSLDLWAMACKYGSPSVTGVMTAGHELPDVSRETNGNFTFPVAPSFGNLISATPWADDDDNTRYKLQILASMTIKDGDFTRQILIASTPYDVETSRTAIRAAASNIARATGLNVGNDQYAILSIGKMWVVPQSVLTPTTTSNATLVWGEANQSLAVIYSNENFSKSLYGDRYANTFSFNVDGENVMMLHRIGNYGAYFDAILTGNIHNVPVWDFTVDFTSGHFSATMTYCGQRVDFANALTLTASAASTKELELSRQITDAIGLISGVGGIAVGAFTGSPVAIAQGIMSTAGTIGNMVTNIRVSVSGITGDAMGNMASASYLGGAPDFVPSIGFMFYSPSNGREVLAELSRIGFVGASPVSRQSMNAPVTHVFDVDYKGAYRRYENAVIFCNYSRANDELRRMAEEGYTVYYTSKNAGNAGALLETALNF